MTPKQKSEDLRSTFSDVLFDEIEGYYQRNHIIKLCSLIVVDEILEVCPLKTDWYWQEVKQEIKNL